jgi:sortase A
VGVALVGWVAWEVYGTTWVSHRTQHRLVDRLEESWASGEGSVRSGAGPATAVVRIPRFGADWVVPLVEGTSDQALASGLGHLEGTVGPGQPGNFALAGHRITHGEPLRDMPDLRVGDTIVVETARTTYTYVLDTGGADLVVPFGDTWVLDPFPANPGGGVQPPDDVGDRLITLTTCSELFHTDDRLVAFGHLESERPRVATRS